MRRRIDVKVPRAGRAATPLRGTKEPISRSVKFAAACEKYLTDGTPGQAPVHEQLWTRFNSGEMDDGDRLALAKFFADSSLQREKVEKALGLGKRDGTEGPKSLTQVLNVENLRFDTKEDAEKFLLDNLHGRTEEPE